MEKIHLFGTWTINCVKCIFSKICTLCNCFVLSQHLRKFIYICVCVCVYIYIFLHLNMLLKSQFVICLYILYRFYCTYSNLAIHNYYMLVSLSKIQGILFNYVSPTTTIFYAYSYVKIYVYTYIYIQLYVCVSLALLWGWYNQRNIFFSFWSFHHF